MKQQQLLELYDNYSDNAFRLAMSFLGNIADSEDIVQNVYTKLIEKSPHISRGCEKSYILTMTANMCRNHLKSAANRLNSSYEELANDDLTSGFNMEEQSMFAAINTYRTAKAEYEQLATAKRNAEQILHGTPSRQKKHEQER